MISAPQLLSILRVGHDTSMSGEGVGLREAIVRSNYEHLRPNFGPADLLPLVEADHSLIEEWAAYSRDKRTSGGWYLDDLKIGQLNSPGVVVFPSTAEAVANYVVCELDFWVSVRAAGKPDVQAPKGEPT